MKFYRDYQPSFELDYKDVFIVPQYSEVISRKHVDTSVEIVPGLKLDVPIFSANMVPISESKMCIALWQAGAMGVMHRFMPIKENVLKYQQVKLADAECFVSLGVNDESKERAEELYNAGAKYFCIDIAHGNSLQMKNMILWLREQFKNKIVIMAGNVTTLDGVENLKTWGVDICKLFVAPGAVCITKNQTACAFPVMSALIECAQKAKELGIPVIADGGLTEFGDVCRALGAGATAVMSGKFFAGCLETPGDPDEHGNKPYFGSASNRAMKLIKREEDMTTPEGKEINVKAIAKSSKDIVKELKGALQSSMSYSNSKNIKEFQDKVIFGIRNV